MTRRTVPRLRRSPAGSDNEEVDLETELRALSPDLGRPRLEENSVALPGMEGRGEVFFWSRLWLCRCVYNSQSEEVGGRITQPTFEFL